MKNIHAKLQAIRETVTDEVEQRMIAYGKKQPEWQLSLEGISHHQKTRDLDVLTIEIDAAIESVHVFFKY